MSSAHIVQLESSVWLAPWKGDPGRTLVQTSAKTFATRAAATRALARARKFRPFPAAQVVEVPS